MPVDENLSQDLGWAPVRYPTYSAFEQGEWRPVLENGEPVAFVWKNSTNGAGIKWITQTDTVVDIQRVFRQGAAGEIPAGNAFSVVETRFGHSLGDSHFGTLGDADAFLNTLDED